MKKIMFNDQYGLTKAVLSGYKTVTRRIMNRQPDPTEIGKAIDGAIRELRNFQRLKVKIEKKKLPQGEK